MSDWRVRRVGEEDFDALVSVWHDAWHDAHATHVPAALTAMRTPAKFADRLAGLGDAVRAIGPVGGPVGLCAVLGDQIYQIYVSRAARGTGAAGALLRDGEMRLAGSGVTEAWLDCVVENVRAIRFYTRQGWVDSGNQTVMLDGADSGFPLNVRVFRKNSEFVTAYTTR